MKKLLATILAFVYLSTSVGATIHLHYCMGKLASWGLVNHERTSCTSCGMVIKKTTIQGNCCKDEHKLIKTGTDQKLSPSEIFKFENFSPAIAIKEPSTRGIKPFSYSVAFPNINAPPLFDKYPRFIFYCDFRI